MVKKSISLEKSTFLTFLHTILILVFKYLTTNLQIILWLATKSTINVEMFVMNVVCFRTFCDAFTAKELFARAVQKELALLNEICVLFEINI